MGKTTKARKYNSPILQELLDEVTPLEMEQTELEMLLIAIIEKKSAKLAHRIIGNFHLITRTELSTVKRYVKFQNTIEDLLDDKTSIKQSLLDNGFNNWDDFYIERKKPIEQQKEKEISNVLCLLKKLTLDSCRKLSTY